MNDNFIFQDYLDDLSICDELLDYYEQCPDKKKGMCNYTVNENIKKSTDVWVGDFTNPVINKYLNSLQIICNKYIDKYKWVNEYSAWGIVHSFNIQRYKPNEGFFEWHTERSRATQDNATRHMVFMTYLNDVTDQGETEFYYQKLKIQPRKGLTVLWPADWTFTHRGITSPSQEKTVVTGWYNFFE